MNRKISLGVIALVSLAALTGCTGSGAFPSASPTTSATATAAPTTDAGKVAAAYEDFLNGLYSLDSNQQAEITALSQQYPTQEAFAKLTVKQQQNVVNTVLKIDPALSLVDVTTLDLQQRFYTYATLLYLGSLGSPQASTDLIPEVVVDSKQVKVSGSAATVPLGALVVTGTSATPVPYPTDAPIVAKEMPFKEVGGKWLIDGKKLADEGARATTSTPTPSTSAGN